MTDILGPCGDSSKLRQVISEIIGVPLDDLEDRAGMGFLTDDDMRATRRLQELVGEMASAARTGSNIVVLCYSIPREALECCLAVAPSNADEDTTQRVMALIMEIKRIVEANESDDN